MELIGSKLTRVDCKYGAPMGRVSFMADNPFTVKFHLHIVRLDSGGYDSGGAYWGLRLNGERLFRAWTPHAEAFYSARTRAEAKAKVLADWDHASFYR